MIAAAFSASLLLGVLPVPGTAPSEGTLPDYGTDVGDRHPPIVLPSLDGNRTLSLSQFAGKKVLLVQFASW